MVLRASPLDMTFAVTFTALEFGVNSLTLTLTGCGRGLSPKSSLKLHTLFVEKDFEPQISVVVKRQKESTGDQEFRFQSAQVIGSGLDTHAFCANESPD